MNLYKDLFNEFENDPYFQGYSAYLEMCEYIYKFYYPREPLHLRVICTIIEYLFDLAFKIECRKK